MRLGRARAGLARRLCWLLLLMFIVACGGGTTSGANTLQRGVPQDEEMPEPMPEAQGEEGENGGAAAAEENGAAQGAAQAET